MILSSSRQDSPATLATRPPMLRNYLGSRHDRRHKPIRSARGFEAGIVLHQPHECAVAGGGAADKAAGRASRKIVHAQIIAMVLIDAEQAPERRAIALIAFLRIAEDF